MVTKSPGHADIQIRSDGGVSSIRRNRRGVYGSGPDAATGNPNDSTVTFVNTEEKPAASNIARGIIYTSIGADLVLSNTKSLVVHVVEDVLNYAAPHYYSQAKSVAESIPYVGEIFSLAGLAILIDGAIRLTIGGYRYAVNR